MEPFEIQAKITLAAALILSHAVEVPTLPTDDDTPDAAAVRLRALTDHLYDVLTTPRQ